MANHTDIFSNSNALMIKPDTINLLLGKGMNL